MKVPYSPHPGKILNLLLSMRNVPKSTIMWQLGLAENAVNALLAGKYHVDEHLANRMAILTGQPKRYWETLQDDYDAAVELQENLSKQTDV